MLKGFKASMLAVVLQCVLDAASAVKCYDCVGPNNPFHKTKCKNQTCEGKWCTKEVAAVEGNKIALCHIFCLICFL